VAHALRHQLAAVLRVYVQQGKESRSRHEQLLGSLVDTPVWVEKVSADDLHALTGTNKHQGIAVALVGNEPMDEHAALEYVAGLTNPLILILDSVEDPRNLGACLRTADGAGVDLVVTPRSRGAGLTPVASKVASGAAEVQMCARVANLARFIKGLRDLNVWVIGTDERAPTMIFDAGLTGAIALVMGGEGKGLRRLTRELCDTLVHLPMQGAVESLNVSVAAGICLYECVRQRR